MPQVIELPDRTELEFPDDMPDDAIKAAITKNYPQFSKPAEPASPIAATGQSGERQYGLGAEPDGEFTETEDEIQRQLTRVGEARSELADDSMVGATRRAVERAVAPGLAATAVGGAIIASGGTGVIPLVASALAAGGTAYGAGKGQEALTAGGELPEVTALRHERINRDIEQHPIISAVVPALAGGFRPSPSQLKNLVTGGARLITGRGVSEAEKFAVSNAAMNSLMNAAQNTVTNAVTGRPLMENTLESAAVGAAFNTPTKIARALGIPADPTFTKPAKAHVVEPADAMIDGSLDKLDADTVRAVNGQISVDELLTPFSPGDLQTGLREAGVVAERGVEPLLRAPESKPVTEAPKVAEPPDRIVSAAHRTPDGQVFDARSEGGVTHMESDIAASAAGRQVDDSMAGFLTESGKFLTREEAYIQAKRNKQVLEELDTFEPDRLHTGKMDALDEPPVEAAKVEAPVVEAPALEADIARYHEIQEQLVNEVKAGAEMNPELVRESEAIKQRVPIDVLVAGKPPVREVAAMAEAPVAPTPTPLTDAQARDQSTRIEAIVSKAVNAGKDRDRVQTHLDKRVYQANMDGTPISWTMLERQVLFGPDVQKLGEGKTTSLQEPTSATGERTVEQTVAATSPAPDVELARSERISTVQTALAEFTPDDRRMLQTIGDRGAQADLANEMGISAQVVSSRAKKLGAQLRQKLTERGVTKSDVRLGATFRNPLIQWIGANAKRLLTAEGDLPIPVFHKWIERSGRVAQEAKAVQFAAKDLFDAVRSDMGVSKARFIKEGLASIPESFVDEMNAALGGDAAALASMTPRIRAGITTMRDHMDALGEEMVRKGLVDSDLAAVISAHKGVYMTRTYKVFEDAEWAKKIPPPIFNRARTLLQRQLAAKNGSATVADADRLLRNMLSDWASEGRDIRARGSKLGAKDISSFIARKNIAPELRAVMGENKNLIHNYATTVSKIARFIADQEFLNSVRQKGLGEFLFESDKAPPGFNTIIAADASNVLSPLNGLRTTPEFARALEEWGKSATDPGPLIQLWQRTNLVAKGVNTVGSFMSQARNALGQGLFFLSNGHFDMRPFKDAIKAVGADLGVSSDAAARALVKDAAAHGLVGENAYAGEFREAWKESGLSSSSDIPDEFASAFVGKRLATKAIKGAEELYQATDELGKVIGWANEQKRIASMNPGMPLDQVKRVSAERIRNTYPTYSMSPRALRLFRQQPFFGPFTTFWYETFRTTFHNLRYGFEDLIGPTAAHKKAGAQRLAGTFGALAAGYAVQAVTKTMLGMDDRQEEDARRMLPPWAQNAQLAFTGKEGHTYDYVNMSYTNPYSTLTDPVIGMISAFQRGDNADEIFGRGLYEVFRPLLDEQIATAALVDVMRNQTKTGRSVYNPQADWPVKSAAIFEHLVESSIQPGTLKRLRDRIIPAFQGVTTEYGRELKPGKEVTAEISGVRFESMDMEQSLKFRTSKFLRGENEAEDIFRSISTRGGTIDNADVVKAYRDSEQSRFELWQEMFRDYAASRRAGVSLDQAKDAMKSRKMTTGTINLITAGTYKPNKPSMEIIAKFKASGHPLPLDELNSISAGMPTVLKDVRRSLLKQE